jgi:uncharacterized protein YbcC (UPF0753/DUF2309 family)
MSLNHHPVTSLSGNTQVRESTSASFDMDKLAIQVAKEIAPLWTLERFVAVNPFMAFTGKPLTEVALNMERWLHADLYPSLDFYRHMHAAGLLTGEDLSYATGEKSSQAMPSADRAMAFLNTTKDFIRRKGGVRDQCPDKLVETNAAKWLSSMLGETGTVWSPKVLGTHLYSAWLALVVHDRTLDIEGFASVRRELKKLSTSPQNILSELKKHLAGSHIGTEAVLRCLSYRNYGWLSYARFLDREAGREDDIGSLAYQVMAIQAAYELALLRSGSKDLSSLNVAKNVANDQLDLERLQLLDLLQEAVEHGARKPFIERFSERKNFKGSKGRQRVQAVFCIDARSEIYRRNLESLSDEIQSVGFAGFFGLTLGHDSPFGGVSSRCPVLLKSSFKASLIGEEKPKKFLTKIAETAKKLISTTFSYVEAYGLLYLPLLVRDMFLEPRKSDNRNFINAEFTLAESGQRLSTENKVTMAKGILKHSGLRARMGRLVLLCGHGSTSSNNSHASGLDCGACGGHRGDINAIAAAAILNDSSVRDSLKASNFEIPMDTWFIAGLHNTTIGTVTLFEEGRVPVTHAQDLADLKGWLVEATALSLKERAASENWQVKDPMVLREAMSRSSNIGEVRPEWGLAQNAFFIAARRETTLGMNLGGRSFLHDYDQGVDEDGGTLELILTAPLVVAHWINMQYYASTVDNRVFGSGTKVLHSPVGSFGVMEGVDSNLRVGLPWQSIHDGEKFVHEPLRLQVFVEAAPSAIDQVLRKHPHIADLVVNKWITLIAIGSNLEGCQRCFGPGRWSAEV